MTLKHWELMPGQAVTLRRVSSSIYDRRATFVSRGARFACFKQEPYAQLVWLALLPDGDLVDDEYKLWQVQGELLVATHERGESKRADLRLGAWGKTATGGA
jgi:hypothetical protein